MKEISDFLASLASPEYAWLTTIYVKAIECILVILINFIIYKILRKIIKVFVKKFNNRSEDKKPISRKATTVMTVLNSALKYFMYFVALCQLLAVFQVPIGSSVLAVAGVGSVAIGLGAQGLIKDVISGIFILLEDQFGVSDFVTIEGKTGTVEAVGIRTTVIRSFNGDVHIIPNGEIKIVTNMSKEFKCAIIDVGISYNEDVDRVLRIMEAEMETCLGKVEGLISVPKVLGITELGNSCLNIRITANCEVGQSWAVERELRRLIKLRFDKEGISIPYPQLTIHNA